jgi:hypothetical protein
VSPAYLDLPSHSPPRRYFALLPLWPKQAWSWFHPYTPDLLLPYHVAHTYSPRALMMLVLQVRSRVSHASHF